MDEATSSIDVATDRAIQEVIHSAFEGKTIITIAVGSSSLLP
jgi:ABC-type multidrug transport system fused ATPase/permease subunit